MAIGLCACQEPPSVRLFNNAGEGLTVHLDKGLEGADRLVDDLVPIPVGTSKRYLGERMRGRKLVVSVGSCDYRYVFPPMNWNSPWGYHDAQGRWVHAGRFPVEVQIEPDLTIYFKDSADALKLTTSERAAVRKHNGIAPVAKLKRAQGHGFPIRPISRTCS